MYCVYMVQNLTWCLSLLFAVSRPRNENCRHECSNRSFNSTQTYTATTVFGVLPSVLNLLCNLYGPFLIVNTFLCSQIKDQNVEIYIGLWGLHHIQQTTVNPFSIRYLSLLILYKFANPSISRHRLCTSRTDRQFITGLTGRDNNAHNHTCIQRTVHKLWQMIAELVIEIIIYVNSWDLDVKVTISMNTMSIYVAKIVKAFCFVSRIDMFQVIVLKVRVCLQPTSLLKARLKVLTLE